MRKNIFYIMLLAALTFSFTSCENNSSEGLTRITYYPVLTMQGDATMYVDKGTSFNDPGCTAELNGEDVSSQINVNSNVNAAKSGVYTVTYSVTNEDGFSASASRTVIVTDPNDACEGVFYTTSDSYREYSSNVAYGNNYEVIITNNDDGTYKVSDFLGGWYAQRAGYGSNYAMVGYMTVNADGTLSLVSSSIAGWGDSLVDFTGKFDSAAGTYTWCAEYVSSMKFNVTLTK